MNWTQRLDRVIHTEFEYRALAESSGWSQFSTIPMTTILADTTRVPANACGYVPTPAIIAPVEFTLPTPDCAIPLSEVLIEAGGEADVRGWASVNPWPWKPVTRR